MKTHLGTWPEHDNGCDVSNLKVLTLNNLILTRFWNYDQLASHLMHDVCNLVSDVVAATHLFNDLRHHCNGRLN